MSRILAPARVTCISKFNKSFNGRTIYHIRLQLKKARHNVTTCSLRILPLLFSPPSPPPHNPPLFTFPSLLCLPREYPVSCPGHSGPVSGKERIFLVLKFCSLRLARNSSWSGEPGTSSFGFQLRPGWICFLCHYYLYFLTLVISLYFFGAVYFSVIFSVSLFCICLC
jgi:hypothetical protein